MVRVQHDWEKQLDIIRDGIDSTVHGLPVSHLFHIERGKGKRPRRTKVNRSRIRADDAIGRACVPR